MAGPTEQLPSIEVEPSFRTLRRLLIQQRSKNSFATPISSWN